MKSAFCFGVAALTVAVASVSFGGRPGRPGGSGGQQGRPNGSRFESRNGTHPHPSVVVFDSGVRQVEYVTPVVVTEASNPAPAASIQLVNPQKNRIALSYRLNNGLVQSLLPGTKVEINQTCVISFDRGGNAGRARYSMTDGIYTFQPNNGAWDLFRSTDNNISDGEVSINDDANAPPG